MDEDCRLQDLRSGKLYGYLVSMPVKGYGPALCVLGNPRQFTPGIMCPRTPSRQTKTSSQTQTRNGICYRLASTELATFMIVGFCMSMERKSQRRRRRESLGTKQNQERLSAPEDDGQRSHKGRLVTQYQSQTQTTVLPLNIFLRLTLSCSGRSDRRKSASKSPIIILFLKVKRIHDYLGSQIGLYVGHS